MSIKNEVLLKAGAYKNRVKLNYLMANGKWVTYYCRLLSETDLELPKIRKTEAESKLPKIVRITSRPCFDETNKVHEYHTIEGRPGTINWFGAIGSTEDKEDKRLISRAIDVGEKLARADMIPDLFGILKNYANWLPILLVGLQLLTLVGLYVIMAG